MTSNVVQIEAREVSNRANQGAQGADGAVTTALRESSPPRQYSFPAHLTKRIDRFNRVSVEQLLSELQKLERPYSANRLKHCMLNLVLATRGVAPAFRGVVSGVTRATKLTPEQEEESNDRQVQDLYWLHKMHRHNLNPINKKMKLLFAKDEFDFELAGEIVTTFGRVADKVNSLGIPPSVQAELFSLRKREVAMHLKVYRERARRVEVSLRERAIKSASRLKIEAIPEIMMEFASLDLAGGSPDGAATVWSRMTGCAVNRRLVWRLGKRGEWFKNELAIAFEDKLAGLSKGDYTHDDCHREVEETRKRLASKRRAH